MHNAPDVGCGTGLFARYLAACWGVPVFAVDRSPKTLLLDLAQCCAETLSEYLRREVGSGTRPGIVVSIATAGDLVQWRRTAPSRT